MPAQLGVVREVGLDQLLRGPPAHALRGAASDRVLDGELQLPVKCGEHLVRDAVGSRGEGDGEIEPAQRARRHRRGEDLHHLRRRHRPQYFLPLRLLADCGDKVPDDRQRDIGLEQRDADFAQGGPDIGLGQRAVAAQPVEDIAKAIG